jgi:hypothetical protein
MLRALKICTVMLLIPNMASAIPFYWESKSDEPGFTIDVPSLWKQASRAREGNAYVQFVKPDKYGRVAVEVHAFSSEAGEIDQLILQLRARLAVKYDRLYMVKRKEVSVRKGVEKQLWTASIGKQTYNLTTAFVVADDKVLEVTCVAPVKRRREYEIVFDNAILSLDFSDGKPDSDGGSSDKEPASSSSTKPSSSSSTKPKIEF